MTDMATITAFLGWCTVINSVILLLATIVLMAARDSIIGIHSRLTGVDPGDLPRLYFDYLGHVKSLVLVFNLAPYIALKLMA